MDVVIVNTDCANLASVKYALERLGITPTISDDSARIKQADKVILPGVGSARAAMRNLQQKQLVEPLQQLTQPVLGICLGMQLLGLRSAEGDVDCLGVIPCITERLACANLPSPHMGWNQLLATREHPLTRSLTAPSYCYFVHSYAVPVGDYTLATSSYPQPFSAMIGANNFYGMQFHPERSSAVGERLLADFLAMEAA